MKARQWLLGAFGALTSVSTVLASPDAAAADGRKGNSGDTGDAVSIAAASPDSTAADEKTNSGDTGAETVEITSPSRPGR